MTSSLVFQRFTNVYKSTFLSRTHIVSMSPPPKRTRTDDTLADNTLTLDRVENRQSTMPVPKDKPVLQIKKLTQDAILPSRGSALSAGLDLYSAEETWIPAVGKLLVKTGISIALPDGCYGRVAPRSGLACNHFVDVGAGVIDQDYRGEVKVLLFNFNRVDYQVKKGDRIAQLICEKIYIPDILQVEDLSKTDRGSGGFGSTGKN